MLPKLKCPLSYSSKYVIANLIFRQVLQNNKKRFGEINPIYTAKGHVFVLQNNMSKDESTELFKIFSSSKRVILNHGKLDQTEKEKYQTLTLKKIV